MIYLFWYNKCFLNCLSKAKVAEDLVESSVEYYAPTFLREHLPKDELTLGKACC